MSTVEYTPSQVDFLSRFFGPGNLLRWDAYASGEMPESSRDLLNPLVDDFVNADVAPILPRVSESEPTTVAWYAMARNARQSRALREQLGAFIGPTYTDFTGQYATLDNTDSVEQAVSESFAPFVYRLRVVNHDDRNHVRRQVFLLRSLRDRRTDRSASLVRPVGRLLRDLEMALVVRNEESAWQCLDDLRARGRLSAHNLTFLKVRILSHFAHWNDVLALPEWQSLVAIRRPARVTHALVKAVYATRFAEFESATDVAGCIDRFRELQADFGTLFRTRSRFHDLDTLKAFLLRTVAEQEIRLEAVDDIVNEFPAGHESQPWVEALSDFARLQATTTTTEPVPTVEPLDSARAACELGDFDAAFSLLLDCEPTPAVVRQLLACSYEIDTLDAARETLSFIDACPPEVRDAALSMRAYRQISDALISEVAPAEPVPSADDIPDGWMPWLRRLNQEPAWRAAVELARHGSAEWATDQLLIDHSTVTQFAELLVSSRTPEADAILKNAVPELLKAFLPEGGPIREFKPIYTNLAYAIALDSAIGHDDLTALASLAEAILECPLSKDTEQNEFEELLETIEAAWNHVAAPRHLDWALNALDLLIAYNVRLHAPVDRFFIQITNALRDWSRRIRLDQWAFAEHLASDLGLSDALVGVRPDEDASAEDIQSFADQLSGQTVAIYTLTERIGHRAAQIITRQFEGVKVQLVHDKASTDRLVQLAKNADVFIVNTWDAKHAATNAIRANRPPDSVTLLPQSKTPGSLVHEVYRYLESH